MNNTNLKNHLARETSPYLLQHKDNPVHWFSWGAEAFAAAKQLQRPIFLSIGYSTCYWCHVMEGDSFERDDVAAVLNEHFVCIKVDREERPDVDKIYMDAVMAISGHGGWPLSAFLTPEGQPFYAATFFWRAQFIGLLQRVADLWQSEREKFLNSAAEITTFLNNANSQKSEAETLPSKVVLDQFITQTKQYFDSVNGGFGREPKFPQAERLALLLRLGVTRSDKAAISIVTKSLDAMVRGGLYDHIGGGFHRYSVDANWLVPHFEKMLYDNALLVKLYIDAYRVTGNSSYEVIAIETLDYLLSEMQDGGGGFYAAQDAGEVGEEGEYYTWTKDELRSVLSKQQYAAFAELYQVPEGGNFEGRIIPRLLDAKASKDKFNDASRNVRQLLYDKRLERKRPHRDEKILADWNGLAISAFAEGYRAFGDERYKAAAEAAANFICSSLYSNKELQHSFCAGRADHRAVLSDYTYLVEGMLALYQATWDQRWFVIAQSLQHEQDQLLWDDTDGGYFFAQRSDEVKHFAPSKEFSDGATPAGNAIAVSNLLTFYFLEAKLEWREKAERILSLAADAIDKHAFSHAGLLTGLCLLIDDVQQLVVVGERGAEVVEQTKVLLDKSYFPNVISAWSDGKADVPAIVQHKVPLAGKAALYLCKGESCNAPVTSVEELRLNGIK